MNFLEFAILLFILSSCNYFNNSNQKDDKLNPQALEKRFPFKNIKYFISNENFDKVVDPENKIDSITLSKILPDSIKKYIDYLEDEFFFCSIQKEGNKYIGYTFLVRGDFGWDIYWINYNHAMKPISVTLIAEMNGDDSSPPDVINSIMVDDQTFLRTSIHPEFEEPDYNKEYFTFKSDSLVEKILVKPNGYFKTAFHHKFKKTSTIKNDNYVSKDTL